METPFIPGNQFSQSASYLEFSPESVSGIHQVRGWLQVEAAVQLCFCGVVLKTHGSAEQMPCIYGSHILFLRLINYTLGGVIASLEPMLLGRKGCHHLQHPCEQTLNWSCQNVPLVTTGAKLSWHKLDRTSVFYRKGAGPMLPSHVRPVT